MRPKEAKMQIRKSSVFDIFSSCDASDANAQWNAASKSSEEEFVAEMLKVDLESGQNGLHVLRIWKESPFCRLSSLGSFGMQGLVESGDRIVAIDGKFTRKLTDLESLMANRRFFEITIFDHRTRLTVSWRMQFSDMLEAA